MKISRLLSLLSLSCILFLFSCKKDIDQTVTTPTDEHSFAIPAASPVTGRVTGIVVNENNQPVQNADVKLGAVTVQTDANGFFQFSNMTLDKYVTTVTVNKAGYFKGIRSFSATASRNYVTIKLIPKTLAGTISAGAGGAVNLSNGTVVTFQANGMVIKATGAAYSGDVNVYASYIDPTSSDFATRVPGSMMGQDAQNMFVLQSTGMLAVELESTGGEPLQLASGKPASLKMPIPSSLTGKAPQTIDTWSLDDRGVWIKEATATKNGNFYETTVNHFSFWNCDVPANAVYLTLNVHDQNGNPLSNTWVELTIPNNNTWWATTYGLTDSAGVVAGLVPAGLALDMSVFPNFFNCGTPITTQSIGPFSSDTTMNVTVTFNSSQYVTISGTLNDCNNQPVDSGTVTIQAGNYSYYYGAISNGSYSVTFASCSNITSANVWLYDNATGASASPVNVTISGNNVTVPLQTACTASSPATYNSVGCSVYGNYQVGVPVNAGNYILSVVEVLTPGTYDITTNTAMGIVFTGSGTFDHVGLDTILLAASGTPTATGIITFGVPGGAGQACGVSVFINGNNPTAGFTINCASLVVNGNYVVNYPLQPTDYISLTVDVTTAGSYNINTGTSINGMYFQDSGVFLNTGVQTIQLQAYGTPLNTGTYTFLVWSNNQSICSFNVTASNTGSAVYTFEGAPGSCSATSITGNYQAGVAMTGNNTITIMLNVTAVGSASVMTSTINGVYFMGNATYTATGVFPITLTANGTPTQAGVYTYQPTGGNAQGCQYVITYN